MRFWVNEMPSKIMAHSHARERKPNKPTPISTSKMLPKKANPIETSICKVSKLSG